VDAWQKGATVESFTAEVFNDQGSGARDNPSLITRTAGS